MNDPHILITGNPVDGFQFIGLFEGCEATIAYAEEHYSARAWYVAPIEAPIEEVEE